MLLLLLQGLPFGPPAVPLHGLNLLKRQGPPRDCQRKVEVVLLLALSRQTQSLRLALSLWLQRLMTQSQGGLGSQAQSQQQRLLTYRCRSLENVGGLEAGQPGKPAGCVPAALLLGTPFHLLLLHLMKRQRLHLQMQHRPGLQLCSLLLWLGLMPLGTVALPLLLPPHLPLLPQPPLLHR